MTAAVLRQGPIGERRRTRRWGVLAVLAVLLIAAAWLLWRDDAPPAEAPSLASLTVTSAPVQRAQWPGTLEATGVVAPWQEAVIGAQVAGLSLLRLEVDIGDVVRRGQVLARFDTATLRAEIAELDAAVTQAEGVQAQSDANQTRALRLKGSGGISEQEVQRYVTEAVTARAQVTAARAQREAKRLQLRQADIVAPDDGVISARTATVGTVSTSGQELFRLVRQRRLEWRGEFTAAQVTRIAVGQPVTLSLPDGGQVAGRVRQVAPLLDEHSRLATVYVNLDPDSPARGGMYVGGRIELPAREALTVPASSVVIRDGHSIVFRLDGAGAEAKVRSQPVVVGRRYGAEVEILEPLADGDRVVAQGAGLLADGDTVRVAMSTGPASTADASAPGGGR